MSDKIRWADAHGEIVRLRAEVERLNAQLTAAAAYDDTKDAEVERLRECCQYIMAHPLLDEMTIRCRIHEALQAVPIKGDTENDHGTREHPPRQAPGYSRMENELTYYPPQDEATKDSPQAPVKKGGPVDYPSRFRR